MNAKQLTVDLVISGAHVVACDEARTTLASGGIAIRDGEILAVGDDAALEPYRETAREVIDAGGQLLAPGLVNTHCHAGDSLFRGLVENLPLEPWLQKVWQAEGEILSPETTRLGASLGLAENLLAGVTTVMDMFWFPEQAAEAAKELGMRVSTGPMFFDFPGMDGMGPEDREPHAKDFCSHYKDDALVMPVVTPHGTYTVGPELFETAWMISEAFDVLFSTHAAETVAENKIVEERYGKRVIPHLDSLGVLADKTILAHCVHLTQEEIETLARTGATVSHNPVSNLKLASGVAPIPELVKAGARVALGTDGPISGNDLDPWMALRLASLLHKGNTQDAQVIPVDTAVAMATRNGAEALRIGDKAGSLEVGKWADCILLRMDRPHTAPIFDGPSHLVFSACKNDVTNVWVGGNQVVADGELTQIDLARTIAEIRELEPKIAASIAE